MVKAPIFAIESLSDVRQGYLDAFSSPDAAEGELEAVDIENERFIFYDTEGTILVPDLVEPPGKFRPGRWKLRQPTDARRDPEALRSVLVQFLAVLGEKVTGMHPDALQRFDLPKLVELALPFTTYQ